MAQAFGVGLIRYLIDTNVASEMRKPKPHAGALAWLHSLDVGQGFFSTVTFGEIQKGVELARQQDLAKANEIESWATQLERVSQVLPIDAACFREYARLMHHRSDTVREDAMIAPPLAFMDSPWRPAMRVISPISKSPSLIRSSIVDRDGFDGRPRLPSETGK